MSKPKADQITVRLGDDDRAVLSWLTDYVRATVGAGIDVRDSDAVRWALHTCKAGLDVPANQTEEGR